MFGLEHYHVHSSGLLVLHIFLFSRDLTRRVDHLPEIRSVARASSETFLSIFQLLEVLVKEVRSVFLAASHVLNTTNASQHLIDRIMAGFKELEAWAIHDDPESALARILEIDCGRTLPFNRADVEEQYESFFLLEADVQDPVSHSLSRRFLPLHSQVGITGPWWYDYALREMTVRPRASTIWCNACGCTHSCNSKCGSTSDRRKQAPLSFRPPVEASNSSSRRPTFHISIPCFSEILPEEATTEAPNCTAP